MNRTALQDPVRKVSPELLANLELTDTKIYDLPGGVGRRWVNEIDPRLNKTGATPVGDTVAFYQHIASVRDTKTKVFYVAFRETVDAQLARTRGELSKYPEWLMKSPIKQNERLIFIYVVMKHPKDIAVMRSQEDWLAPIADPRLFDALWYFLGQHNLVPMQR